MQKDTLNLAVQKSGLSLSNLDYVLGGDLLNQCIGTTFSVKDCGVPFLGLYGACSTMAGRTYSGFRNDRRGIRRTHGGADVLPFLLCGTAIPISA